MLSLPFVVTMGALPLIFNEGGVLLLLVGIGYVSRAATFPMTSPLDDAFNMEAPDAKERATNTAWKWRRAARCRPSQSSSAPA